MMLDIYDPDNIPLYREFQHFASDMHAIVSREDIAQRFVVLRMIYYLFEFLDDLGETHRVFSLQSAQCPFRFIAELDAIQHNGEKIQSFK